MVYPIDSALSGLRTFEKKMRVTANNVANVNSTGFKASRAISQDMAPQSVATAAGTAQIGRGTSVADIHSHFSMGPFEPTDSPTDLAIGGRGFFVLRDADDPNTTFYTRTGIFRFDHNGNLSTPDGYIARGWPVDTNGQPTGGMGDIAISFTAPPNGTANGTGALQSIAVDTDGIVTGHYSNGQDIPLFQLALADFQNVHGLRNEGGNRYRDTGASGAPFTGSPGTQGLGDIAPNALEQSNVDLAKEIVNTMITQRGFQANAKLVKVADEMLETVIDIFA
jgi:flagellar hook protein FlgE